ncbi:MAG: 3-hydroxyacyl-CoA dehydrogenase family protein [Dehalococcoidales bacterium]|nr:3-hydroxyacyl-CoA dehydrogenase family protein [Dehalococcoidales bacterium]
MNKIKKVLVIGSGTMGHGIAQVFAQGGYEVALQDTVPQALERAAILIRSSLETMVEAGLVKKEEIDPIIGRIKPAASLEEAARDADLAIECIVENKEAKSDLFKKLDVLCPPKTLLASNSSFLNIFEFVQVSRPEKLLGIHFYSPPQIIPLVDIVKGPQTDEQNIRIVTETLRGIGKKPIIFNKPVAGYLVSRLQVAFQREVYWLLDNNYLSPKDIDEAAIWGLALRMLVVGICQRIDFGGLDLSARTTTQSGQSTPVDYIPVKLNEMVKKGELGVKAGRGFYDYEGKSEAEMCRERDVRLLKLLKLLQEANLTGPIM